MGQPESLALHGIKGNETLAVRSGGGVGVGLIEHPLLGGVVVERNVLKPVPQLFVQQNMKLTACPFTLGQTGFMVIDSAPTVGSEIRRFAT